MFPSKIDSNLKHSNLVSGGEVTAISYLFKK